MKKRIVVPIGMLKAAEDAVTSDPSSNGIYLVVEGALRWLSENPIMPTHYQIDEMQSACGLPVFAHHGFERICTEWQKRMFIAPEEIAAVVRERDERIAALESQLAQDQAAITEFSQKLAALTAQQVRAIEAQDLARLVEEGVAQKMAAERERLCAPVSDEEFERYHGHDVRGIGMFNRCDVNLLIRQRTASLTAPAQEAQKEKE